MVDAVQATTSVYKMYGSARPRPATAPGEAGGPAVDAGTSVGMSKGLARCLARDRALGLDRQQVYKPLRMGPIRTATRPLVNGVNQPSAMELSAYYQDLRSGCPAGPKSASAVAAENRYLQARGILS